LNLEARNPEEASFESGNEESALAEKQFLLSAFLIKSSALPESRFSTGHPES